MARLDDFKNKLFKQASEYGYTDYELYSSAAESFEVRIFNHEIQEYINTDSFGISFRGTFNGRVGYAYTERADDGLIPDMLKNAAENSKIIEEKEIEKLFKGDHEYPEWNGYNAALDDVSAREKIDMALSMEKFAYSLDPRVKSIDYCVLGTVKIETTIANSYGLDKKDKKNFAFAFLYARVEENGVTKTGVDMWHGNDFAKFSYEKTAKTAVEKACSYLGASSVQSGAYSVLFDNDMAADFFSAFTGIFYAENAQKGFSLLKGKEGQQIASRFINLRDDGICDKSYGSVTFDSEGVATKNKAVIENGILKTLLYNTKSAEKDGVKSTGNGFKPSFRSSVGTACTNFYIEPSEEPREKIISGIEKGLLITELAGLHSGTDSVSGDFSLSADGFLIENGKISRPVEQITIAGNFFEMLKNTKQTGNDLRFQMPSGNGTIGMPSILAEGLVVTGL
ncbi:MAG: TldD/PmbA family protein [Defluviitaleaceae bacterium]|nr:TldD/PmbA family protein [Defluviitaleaceae bacterium]